MATLVDAGEELIRTCSDLHMAVLSVLDLGKTAWKDLLETSGDSHAGEVETSLMLHLHPEWVEGSAPEAYPHFPDHILVRNKRAYWPTGVWGNPEAASAEKGEKFLESSVESLCRLIDRLESLSSDRDGT